MGKGVKDDIERVQKKGKSILDIPRKYEEEEF
jgi:hypothetical protein